jgi:hypothetical protein
METKEIKDPIIQRIVPLTKKWFAKLNKELFENKLATPTITFSLSEEIPLPDRIPKIDMVTKYTHQIVKTWQQQTPRGTEHTINIDCHYCLKAEQWMIIAYLLHGMVHQWQLQYGKPDKPKEIYEELYKEFAVEPHNKEYLEKAREVGILMNKNENTIDIIVEPLLSLLQKNGYAKNEKLMPVNIIHDDQTYSSLGQGILTPEKQRNIRLYLDLDQSRFNPRKK